MQYGTGNVQCKNGCNFEIASMEPEVTREKAMRAFMAIREQSAKNYPDGMSLDDINEEIRKARYGEKGILSYE